LTVVGFSDTVFRNGLALVVWVKGCLRFGVKRGFPSLGGLFTPKATRPLPSKSLAALEAELCPWVVTALVERMRAVERVFGDVIHRCADEVAHAHAV
jgi:hypothetical protein